jgi:D-alanyl-lipoteichoic acid acyltransferase DltB (MBOAT superfamily)
MSISNIISSIDFDKLQNLLLYDAHSPLLFNTGLFMCLFVVFLAIYKLVERWHYVKMIFVILFSLYFYYKSSAECCFILLGVCVSDYLLGNLLSVTKWQWARKSIVALNVVINVGMLVYFKYFTLLLETFTNIDKTAIDAMDIVLPAGISFFTFRSISYIVDIYRGQLEAERNPLNYIFFLTFFPPLLAGPVVRAKDMLPQVRENRSADAAMVAEGLFMVMIGLIKKVVIADYISGNFVDRIFDSPSLYSGFENLVGCVAFTLQLYCDFSGYSDMAIGIALMLGYRFKDNFNAPFKSQNPTEFWRRWHISLSTWLRDYIYIPLGGSRRGTARMRSNLLITMLVGGIWHGASWMYLLWGAYHGVLLVVHKWLTKVWRLPEMLKGTFVVRTVNIVLTMALIILGFTIFRADSFATVQAIFTQIFTDFHGSVALQFVEGYPLVVAAIVAGYVMHYLPTSWTKNTATAYVNMPMAVQILILSVVLFVVVQTRCSDLVPFIYLQY